MIRNPSLFFLLVAAAVAACNGGSDRPPQKVVAASPKPPPAQPSPWTYQPCESGTAGSPADAAAATDGIWQGSLTNELTKTKTPWSAIVSADGRFHLRSTGHTQMAGTLDVDGNAYTGEGFAETGGATWHDGSQVSTLTVAGTIAERDRLSGDFVLASGDAGCFEFAYDAELYERPSSLDLVAGRWIDYDDWSWLWVALDVTAEGAITGLDIYGCDYAGAMVLQDERFNLYTVALDIMQRTDDSYTCWGPGGFEGFAYLEDAGDGSIANHFLHLALVDGDNASRFVLHR